MSDNILLQALVTSTLVNFNEKFLFAFFALSFFILFLQCQQIFFTSFLTEFLAGLTICSVNLKPILAVIKFSAEFAHPCVFRKLRVLFLLDFILWLLSFARNANSKSFSNYDFLATFAYP